MCARTCVFKCTYPCVSGMSEHVCQESLASDDLVMSKGPCGSV